MEEKKQISSAKLADFANNCTDYQAVMYFCKLLDEVSQLNHYLEKNSISLNVSLFFNQK